MPITINGSGTVTGLSAGGLPANSITATSIADNAVTADKLADLYSSGAMNIGGIRIVTGTVTTGSTAGSTSADFGVSCQKYLAVSGTFSGFKSGTTPSVVLSANTGYHESKVATLTPTNTGFTATLSCSRVGGVQNITCCYIAIGEAA